MTTLISIALVPFAPLLSLPPKLVATAASCACLLGGAALGVAKVRAGQPRAAEVTTATFAAVGASIAVAAWWLLASGGVGTVKSGDDKRKKKKKMQMMKKKESGSGGASVVDEDDEDENELQQQPPPQSRPLALAARFASVPWKAAQRASKAGGAICPFTGKLEREKKREVKKMCPFALYLS